MTNPIHKSMTYTFLLYVLPLNRPGPRTHPPVTGLRVQKRPQEPYIRSSGHLTRGEIPGQNVHKNKRRTRKHSCMTGIRNKRARAPSSYTVALAGSYLILSPLSQFIIRILARKSHAVNTGKWFGFAFVFSPIRPPSPRPTH